MASSFSGLASIAGKAGLIGELLGVDKDDVTLGSFVFDANSVEVPGEMPWVEGRILTWRWASPMWPKMTYRPREFALQSFAVKVQHLAIFRHRNSPVGARLGQPAGDAEDVDSFGQRVAETAETLTIRRAGGEPRRVHAGVRKPVVPSGSIRMAALAAAEIWGCPSLIRHRDKHRAEPGFHNRC